MNQRSRNSGQAFAPPGETETVRGGGRDADGRADDVAHGPLRLALARQKSGTLPDDLDRNIGYRPTAGAGQTHGFGKERAARSSGPFGPSRAECRAEVSDARGDEDGVARGVGGDVSVGMPFEPAFAGPLEAREKERAGRILTEGVHVDSCSHANVHAEIIYSRRICDKAADRAGGNAKRGPRPEGTGADR